MYNKTERKVKSTIVKNYRTFGVSITELQVRYKNSFRKERLSQDQKNSLSVIYIYIYIYLYIYIYIARSKEG